MAKTLPLSEVKARLPELLTAMEKREEEIVVTKHGRPTAVLINVQEYARLESAGSIIHPQVVQVFGE